MSTAPDIRPAATALLQLSPELAIPLEAVTETFAIHRKRGRGKTSTAVVLAEEMIHAGIPVIVVDTVGAWWGLRSSADGKSAGLPVVVFGGDHADVPLEEGSGRIIADVLMEHRLNAVVDTSALSKAAARRFLAAFVTELYHRNRDPLHVIFDEADELAPQRPGPEGTKLLSAMEDFVRRGRRRGLGCTLVTQRPAVLNKDVLTQVEVLVSMGMTGPRDVAAINEWIRLHADDEEAKEVRATLASLPVGTAWVWSPEWLQILKKVEIRRRDTFDSSATPRIGAPLIQPKARTEVDLAQLGEQIGAAVEQAKVSDPKFLRARIDELEHDIHKLRSHVQVERVEVPVLSAETEQALRASLAESARQVQALEEAASVYRAASDAIAAALPAAGSSQPLAVVPTRTAPIPAPASQANVSDRGEQPAVSEADRTSTPLPKAQRAILSVLALHGARSKRQVSLLTGYASEGGGFNNALGNLRTSGLMTGTKESLTITDEGRRRLGPIDALPSGAELVSFWMHKLGKAERAILTATTAVWPQSMSKAEIAEQAGYEASGGGFNNALGRLRTLNLIAGGRDEITAAAELGESIMQHDPLIPPEGTRP